MDKPRIGKIWRLQPKESKQLGFNDTYSRVILYQSTCGKYWSGITSVVPSYDTLSLGAEFPEHRTGEYLKIEKEFTVLEWDTAREAIYTGIMRPPDEFTPSDRVSTLKEVRTKRFPLVLKDM